MYTVTMGVVNKNLTLLKEEKNAEYRSGSVNVDKIIFNFSGSDWDDLTKIAVFVTESGSVIDVPLIGNYCIVPSEAYITSHTDLRDVDFYYDMVVGVYGQTIDSETNKITKVLPTNLVRRKVRLGSYLPGVTPSDLPTAEQWQIYIDEVSQLASRAEASEKACAELEKAIQEIYKDIQDIEDNVTNLESSANNSAQSAMNSMNYASNYMNNAYNYATNSEASAIESSNYANASRQYASNAQNYMNSAQNYASNASNYASNASHYMNNASNYANNSYNSATLSSEYANHASSYMNSAQNYSNSAFNYSNSASAANNSAQNIYNEIWDISAARMFAAFDVNPQNGDLIMTSVQSMGNIGFSLDTNGNLVITLN